MMRVINSSPGKHIIYSNFVQTGIDVEQSLLKEGWKKIMGCCKDECGLSIKVKCTTWVEIQRMNKSMIKSIANKKENIFEG
jgi:hypothetical protein